ncbi:DUF5392 family protein [Pontibacillus salicampi]|uniref:DUF5392 family protein n=1 Tax=Pontibacillus salicampi TaxID=1449801 RepID=A0ABV6LQ52_9BACI
MFMNLSNNMEQEMEKMQESLAPLMKKMSKYSFASILLVSFSVLNLLSAMFFIDGTPGTVTLLVLAGIGAFGMALNKEKKHYKKEMNKQGNEYIMERIKKSRYLSEGRVSEYVNTIKDKQYLALTSFYNFLREEEDAKKQYLYQ